MTGIENHAASFLEHLDKLGLSLGAQILVNEVTDFDQSLQITINAGKQVHISHEVGKNILVSSKN